MDKAFASDTKISNVPAKDKIRGCLIGGAIGDALGYPVEFTSYDQILSQFGDSGITSYKLDSSSQVALISDDTQMSLFTANGRYFLFTYTSVLPDYYTPCGGISQVPVKRRPRAPGKDAARFTNRQGNDIIR